MKVKLKGGPLDKQERDISLFKVFLKFEYYKDKMLEVEGKKRRRKTKTIMYAVYEMKKSKDGIYYEFVSD